MVKSFVVVVVMVVDPEIILSSPGTRGTFPFLYIQSPFPVPSPVLVA